MKNKILICELLLVSWDCNYYTLETDNHIEIIDERILENCFSAKLSSTGIIIVNFNDVLQEVTKEHLVKLTHCIKDLGCGKKMPVFISTINFLAITSDARAYAASSEAQRFTFANAVVIDSTAKSLAFNFYMRINKPTIPTKAFKTENEALAWLSSLNAIWFN